MKESDLTATLTVKYASEGEGAVVAGANAVGAAQEKAAAAAAALAAATENAAKRQVSAAAAFDALARRMDPAARAFADLERNQAAYNRALSANSSIVDKAGQGLDVYKAKLDAQKLAAEGVLRAQEDLRRQQSNLTTVTTTVTGPSNPTQISAAPPLVPTPPNKNNLFEAEQDRLSERLLAYKTALDAGKISQAAFDAEQEKALQTLIDYDNWLNKTTRSVESLNNLTAKVSTPQQPSTNPTQITGAQLSSVNTREYTTQLENAARAEVEMAAATARLQASLNPLGVEEQRVAERLGVLKQALAATMITQGQFDAAVVAENQGLATLAERLKAADVATENLRRQQANASVNQGAGFNPASANTSTYASQFEAAAKAAKAQDDMVAASNRLKAALNPLAAEEAKQVAELGLLKQAQQAGIITAEQFAGAQQLSVTRLANLSQSMKAAGTAGRVMSGEMTNLGFQLNDVVTGLALGQSPFMILGQQGGQIIQIFANSKSSIADFASSSINWFTSLFTVGRTVFGGIAAAVGVAAYSMISFASSQEKASQALIGVGQRTGTTMGQINQFAKENASAAGLSVDQARTVAVEFTKTGNIAVNGLKGMGDAIHGFSILTGQDATEATKTFAKAFSGSVLEGAEELNKTYGFLGASGRDYIRTLELQGDRSKAVQFVVASMAKDNVKAAESVGVLRREWDEFLNVLSRGVNKIGSIGAPPSIQDQFTTAQARRDAIAASPSRSASGDDALKLQALSEADRILADLKKKLDEVNAESAVKQLERLSLAGDSVVRSIIPQIEQLEKLKVAEKAIIDARNASQSEWPGIKRDDSHDNSALTANRNQQAAVQDAMADAERYNQRTKEITESIRAMKPEWADVGRETALALNAAENQLPVIRAVGGAAKMAAQQTADFKNAMDAGKSSTEATALAASNLAAAMAQAKAAAQEQLFALQNGLQVSQAWTAATQMRAQEQATYNKLLHDNVDAETAAAVAAAEYADSKAKAVASAQKLIQSSNDNLDKIKAQGTGMEGVVDSAIAYRDAIQAGATATQAATISANTLEASMLRAAQSAQQMEMDAYKAANSFDSMGNVKLPPPVGSASTGGVPSDFNTNGRSGAFGGDAFNTSVSYKFGGGTGMSIGLSATNFRDIEWAKQKAMATTDSAAAPFVGKGDYAGAIKAIESLQATAGGFNRDGTPIKGGISVSDQISQVDTLTQLLNSQTTDKGTQISNLQAELAWLNKLPETIARDQKIVSLQQSIDSLKNSTDGLNSTMGDLLSPYYTQDPRTSHIGFRSQGMASGGSFIVPGGYSSNDNMIGQIPLASGEEVKVSRPGEKGTQPIIINQTINIQGSANRDEVRRTQYHNGQNLARQLRASAS